MESKRINIHGINDMCPNCNNSLKTVEEVKAKFNPKLFLGIKKAKIFFIAKCPSCESNIRVYDENMQSLIIKYMYKHEVSEHFLEDFCKWYLP